jgi:hypothetical protein
MRQPQTNTFFQNNVKITQRKIMTNYTYIIQGACNKQYEKTFAHIMSHFWTLGIPQQSKRSEYLSTFLMLLQSVSFYS